MPPDHVSGILLLENRFLFHFLLRTHTVFLLLQNYFLLRKEHEEGKHLENKVGM